MNESKGKYRMGWLPDFPDFRDFRFDQKEVPPKYKDRGQEQSIGAIRHLC